MNKVITIAIAACLAAPVLHADPEDLWDVLRMDELVELMAEEGRINGEYLAEQLFERGGGPAWDARLADLYNPEEMSSEIRPAFVGMFVGVDTADLEDFLAADLGQRIVHYELEARTTLIDPEAEAAAAEGYSVLRARQPRRHELIQDFIRANDLVEANVASSLTFTYAFNRGLVDGGMEDMTEGDALSDAWAQEESAREDTMRWLEAQFSVAFAPLSADEVRAYIEMSQTEGGQTLNAALFQAFEPTFSRIARELGEGVARSITGMDI